VLNINVARRTRESLGVEFKEPGTNTEQFVEVTVWSNGEGFDIAFDDKAPVSFTWARWQHAAALVNLL
jgi:hypothetical protein